MVLGTSPGQRVSMKKDMSGGVHILSDACSEGTLQDHPPGPDFLMPDWVLGSVRNLHKSIFLMICPVLASMMAGFYPLWDSISSLKN